jgi:hypothetical protein
MFQFPSLAYAPYVFRYAYPRITTGGFPHSEIPGSLTGQRLPRAYRSRPRPSSPLGAKASTVCPCSLDQKNSGNRCRYGVFKVHASSNAHNRKNRPRDGRSFKTQQQAETNVEVDMILGELNAGRNRCVEATDPSNGFNAYRHEMPASLERR